MKIGTLDLGNKLILAPMAEVSYSPFRKIASENGAGLTFTQMVSAEGVLKNNLETLRLLVFNKVEKPIGVQILGNNPEIIKEAVQEIKIYKPDIIDLNSGCSVSKVCNNNMGSKITDNPALFGRIIRNMADAAGSLPVSVKIRLGANKRKINVIEIAKIAEENGAAVITIHARTRDDAYINEPQWEWIRKVKESVNIPVIGNGSIFTPHQAVEMIKQTGADSVMVARGALGNPFLFSRFNSLVEKGIDSGQPGIQEVFNTIIKQIEYSVQEFGEVNSVLKIKKHIIWYLRFYGGIENLIKEIENVRDINSLITITDNHCRKIQNNDFTNEDIDEIENKFRDRVVFWADNNI